ncbi:MAG: uracil-DNA glycosylase [Candidatus Bathyarchaeota archaeon]|nr:uracil-DNA glycosylase [Candidatus Bathyarchaeota archaeon]
MSVRELIEEISAQVSVCSKCRLSQNRKSAVPGDGNIHTRLMLVGEAPGRQEDLRGLPFVGAAGKTLDKLLQNAGLSRREVFVTNIVKCRPPGNRDPLKDEIATCTGLYLKRQIQAIQPRVLVMLGRHSTNHFLSESGLKVEGITRIHGKVYKINPFNFPIVAIPMFHPASLLYNLKYKSLLEEDFKVLKSQLKKLESDIQSLDTWMQ